MHCSQGQSVWGQLGHYGSWGSQECSCPSVPSNGLSAWGCLGHWLGGCPAQPLYKGSHQSGHLVSQLCSSLYRFCGHGWLSPYLVMGFFIFTLCLVSSNHQLGIGGPGIAIEISSWISNMLADPTEEMIFEMLLHLSICYPPGAWQPDLIRVPSSLVAKEGTFLWLPWLTLLKFCIKTSNDTTVPKLWLAFVEYGPCWW